MNYLEAKSKSDKYKIDEFDFKNTLSFIFAIEFLEEEELKEQSRIKVQKEYKEFLNYHEFNYRDNKCNKCGIDKYKYTLFRERPSCYEVISVLEKTNVNISQIEDMLQERR